MKKFEAWVVRETYLGIVKARNEAEATKKVQKIIERDDRKISVDYEEEISIQEYEE